MPFRIMLLLSTLAAGAIIGSWLEKPLPGEYSSAPLWGAFVALLLLWLRDTQRSAALSAWLREGAPERRKPHRLHAGMWSAIEERIIRLQRRHRHDLEQAEQRTQRFLAAIQALPIGVVLLDSQNRVDWSNIAADLHFGLNGARDHMQHLTNLVRQPAFIEYLHHGAFDKPLSILWHSGDGKLSVQIFRYSDDGHKLVLSRDVTDIERTDRMRRDFVANVSHEIRTPLTVLTGFIETMQHLALTEDERQHQLQLMAQQSHRLQLLVSDLLILARLEGDPPPPADNWVNVKDILSHAEQEARVLSKGRHHLSFTGNAPSRIAGAESELISALTNLVSNAVHYTPPGGKIDIGWRLLPDGSGEFYIHDNGPGIAQEHLARLSERFYRVDRSRSRETGGTGLGLSIVKHIQTRHGGTLEIISTVGEGATFRLHYPAQRICPIAETISA